MNTLPASTPAAIALNRFGLGARAGDTAPADPKGWVLAQFERYEARNAAWAAQPASPQLAVALEEMRAGLAKDDAQAKQAARKDLRKDVRDTYWSAVNARVDSALTTPSPFVERLVHFWANHFAVSVEKPAVAMLAGSFEAEAIRPHVLGRFQDMLMAAEQHPAMLLFLDQARSIGPDSKAAERAARRDRGKKLGLNENLAREIMELHTLGARTGYTQADVTEFARALTGWSIATGKGRQGDGAALAVGNGRQTDGAALAMGNGRQPDGARLAMRNGAQPDGAVPGTFLFRPALHEPGTRVIMGRSYAQQGEQQALSILADLAASESTARHIATKLARHFIADEPSPAAVDMLAQAFTRSGGDLPTVYRVLVQMPQAWSPVPVKFKTPWEWTISALRGLGWQTVGKMNAAPLLTQLGQAVWKPGSPAGYDDIMASWAAPDALVRRVEAAQRLAARQGDRADPAAMGRTLLAGSLNPATATAVGRAESVPAAVALLLVSPDFQRR